MRSQLTRSLQKTEVVQSLLKARPERIWIKRGQQMALDLFYDMAERVPAYKDFLKRNNFDPNSVRTIDDFSKIPLVDKDNYLRKYPRNMLCWDGSFSDKRWVISTTSGSTGEPFYFPRTDLQDEYYALTAELYLRENYRIHEKSTLYIDAFAMGAWIGGLFTYEAIKRVAEKGYQLSIITPGINKAEVINSVKRLGGDFDQVIIGCYPPIMKDIIDLGNEQGINWDTYNLGIVFSAEGFSEQFRDYIIKHGSLSNVYTSTLNHYGTVDLGTMSHETPVSILLRRSAIKTPSLYHELFGVTNKQPTFTQYIPELFYFEAANDKIICSSRSGIPLVRYDLKDNGGVVTLKEVKRICKRNGLSLENEMQKAGIGGTLWNLPFVYLYERSDFSVTFSGAQIYPEEVRRAVMHSSLEDSLTGKFTMISGYDRRARNYLELNIELKNGVKPTRELSKNVKKLVVETLLKENSEYRVLYGEYKSKLHPKVKLWGNNDPKYFSGQGKQKWVKK